MAPAVTEAISTSKDSGRVWVHETVRNVVVSAAVGEGIDLRLVNPRAPQTDDTGKAGERETRDAT